MKRKSKIILGLLSLSVLACGGAMLQMDTANASAATPVMSFEAGASVRITNDDYGIRFHAYYDDAAYAYATDNNANTKVGMLIVPASVIENVNDNYIETLTATYDKTEADFTTWFEASQFKTEASGYSAYGSIIGILDANLVNEYQAVACTYDGSDYTYSAKSDIRTISAVLNGALNDSELTDTQRGKVLGTAIGVQTANANTVGEYTMDIDVKDGDLGLLTASGYTISSATFGEESSAVTNGKLTLEKTDAFKKVTIADTGAITINDPTQNVSPIAVTYADGKTLTVNATVWSLIINNTDEIIAMNSYTTAASNSDIYGYLKLANNIDMTDITWTSDYMLASSVGIAAKKGFVGVFDGCGYEIQNFSVAFDSGAFIHRLAYISDTVLGTVKNVKFKNAMNYGRMAQGAILSYSVHGGLVENVSIEVSYLAHALQNGNYGTCSGALFGEINGHANMATLTVRNVTLINNSYGDQWKALETKAETAAANKKKNYSLCAFGYINLYNANGNFDFTDNITLENITIKNFGKHTLWVYDNVDNGPAAASSFDGYVTTKGTISITTTE